MKTSTNNTAPITLVIVRHMDGQYAIWNTSHKPVVAQTFSNRHAARVLASRMNAGRVILHTRSL